MRAALIPMKDLDGAKGRLADVLSPAERGGLALAMFIDVAGACVNSRLFDVVTVVSSDSDVFWQTRELGATPLAEPATLDGLNDSLRFGQRYLSRRTGVDELLILPADVPLVRADDLQQVLEAIAGTMPAVALVRARDDGTNALAMRPAEAIDMRFGHRSADAHLSLARETGVPATEVECERLRFDVDSGADVEALGALPVGPATRAWIDGRAR